MRYAPWGETRWSWDADARGYTERLFTSQRRQTASFVGSLYDFNARSYSPWVGRFVSPDGMIPNARNPVDFNRYAYTRNAPLKYRDTSGHWIESALDIAGIAYDIYDISQNGLNWENGLSLAADVAGLILPGVTGGGVIVRAAMHADEVAEGAKAASKIVDAAGLLKKVEGIAGEVKAAIKQGVEKAKSAVSVGTVKSFIHKLERGDAEITDFIFKKASGTPDSLTPRPGIDDLDESGGLSFFNSLENLGADANDKWVQIDPKKFKELKAVFDNDPIGHVSVRPKSGVLQDLKDWAKTRGTNSIHRFTSELLNAITKKGKGSN
jgi:RHS repeat-associated protein